MADLLSQLEQDFVAIQQADPSLADGSRLVYDREVPCELRAMRDGESSAGSLEPMKIKVLTTGEERNLASLRVEVTTESDIFFHYTCIINDQGFLRLREDQNLVCEFSEFLMTLLKMFNRCIREPGRFIAALLLGDDGTANLEFVENLEYKLVSVLVLPFRASPPEVVREQAQYRYSAVRARLDLVTEQIKRSGPGRR
ncbi:hypothetical protein ABL78_1489 [Leptomonas seymouri]|uniref:Spindle assembly abnormal protein 6 N-terminal domain-containing protein n=1 Tax=Leptomonas seymouri TaxID=5684 RepID=A0A0N1I7A5_LEPSE|nr:hypothetical protein ABL78_1489 [Leptomonas seymouri]|eukprot:KPI89363.1 hypothetical protein ABL78_1489 [Leptomonas seymouri]